MPNIPTRQNNPGDLKANGQIATYASPAQGQAALYNDLTAKMTGTTTSGLGPSSTLVDFAKTYAPDSDGNNSLQYAANLANQLGVSPDTQIGSLLPRIDDFAKAVAHNEGYQGQMAASPSGGININSAQASTGSQNTAPESTLQKAGDVAGAVGNFLFPVASDIYDAATGKGNGKTALQVAGDTAMSVLPFVPGLGEVGEAAKGADALAEGAEAAKSAGLLSKVAGSTVARNAVTGYGAGVASNLQQGQSLGQSFMPNTNTVGGGLLGTAGGLAGKALGGILDSATGIPKNRIPLLSSLSDPALYDEYAKVGANRAADERAPSLLQNGIGHAEDAVGQIQQKLDAVGPQVEETKNAEGAKPLQSVVPVLQNFAKNVESYFGKTVTVARDGSVELENAPGRVKNTLSNADEGRIKNALQQLLSLNKGGTVRQASDVIDNLRGLVDYSNKDLLGNSNDPAEGFLKSTAHDLNEVVGKSSPALSAVKSRFSGLSDLLDTIKSGGGSNFQRAGLLLKRALSPDQGDVAQNIFSKIKTETGIDLQEHAGLIKHFTDAIGDSSEKSALANMIEETAKGGAPTIPGLLLQGGKAALNATIADPITQGRRIVQGKPGILQSILRNKAGSITKPLLTAGNKFSKSIGL